MQIGTLEWILQLKKDIGKTGKIHIKCNLVIFVPVLLIFQF